MRNLVQQNITHLHKQRNSIDDAADARRKFILRCRMEALVPYFTSKTHESLMQEAFNFDEEILWRNLERGLLEVGVPSEEDIEKFVETKLMELAMAVWYLLPVA